MDESSARSSPETLIYHLSPQNRMEDSPSKFPSPDQSTSSFTANGCNVCELNMTPDLINRSFNITLKLLSPATSSGPSCRICHEDDKNEDLLSVCKCTGSVGLVHLTCMERWLNTRVIGHDKCEICNFSFETVRSPKSMLEWFQSSQGPMSNRQSIFGDLACFSLITPLAAISTFLCFEGAKRHIKWNKSLEAGCLMALATFLITVYIIWNVLAIRYHLKTYFRWRLVNQTIRLIRYRKKSDDSGISAFNQRNVVSGAVQSEVHRNSVSELAASNQQALSPSESEEVNGQTSNLCLTDN